MYLRTGDMIITILVKRLFFILFYLSLNLANFSAFIRRSIG